MVFTCSRREIASGVSIWRRDSWGPESPAFTLGNQKSGFCWSLWKVWDALGNPHPELSCSHSSFCQHSEGFSLMWLLEPIVLVLQGFTNWWSWSCLLKSLEKRTIRDSRQQIYWSVSCPGVFRGRPTICIPFQSPSFTPQTSHRCTAQLEPPWLRVELSGGPVPLLGHSKPVPAREWSSWRGSLSCFHKFLLLSVSFTIKSRFLF